AFDGARVWDAKTGEQLLGPLKGVHGLNSAEFSRDGTRIVTAEWGAVRVWDAKTGQAMAEPFQYVGGAYGAQFSPDGRCVLTPWWNAVRVFDSQTGETLQEFFSYTYTMNSARFSPDGKRFVTGGQDGTARIWDAHNGQPLTDRLKHFGSVYFADFSP